MTSYREKIENSLVEKALDLIPTMLFALPAIGIVLSVVCDKTGSLFRSDAVQVFRGFSILYFCLPGVFIVFDWLRRDRLVIIPTFRNASYLIWKLIVGCFALTLIFGALSLDGYTNAVTIPIRAIVAIALLTGLWRLLAVLIARPTRREDSDMINRLCGVLVVLIGSCAMIFIFPLPIVGVATLPVLIGIYLVHYVRAARRWSDNSTESDSISTTAQRTNSRTRFASRITALGLAQSPLLLLLFALAIWCFGACIRNQWWCLPANGYFSSTLHVPTNSDSILRQQLRVAREMEQYVGERYLTARMDTVDALNTGQIRATIDNKDSLRRRVDSVRRILRRQDSERRTDVARMTALRPGPSLMMPLYSFDTTYQPGTVNREENSYRWHLDYITLLERFQHDNVEWQKELMRPLLQQARVIGIFIFGLSIVVLLVMRYHFKLPSRAIVTTADTATTTTSSKNPVTVNEISDLMRPATPEQRVQMADAWIVVLILLLIPLLGDIDLDRIDPLKPYWALTLSNWYFPQFVSDIGPGRLDVPERRDVPGSTSTPYNRDTVIIHETNGGRDTVYLPIPAPVVNVSQKTMALPDTLNVRFDNHETRQLDTAVWRLDSAFRVRFFPRTMR